MQESFKAIRDRRKKVVAYWYQHYTLHFGDARTLSETEFCRIFEPAVLHRKNDLLEKKVDRYAEDVRRLGVMRWTGRTAPGNHCFATFV